MLRGIALGSVCLLAACGGGSDYHPEFSEAEADASECPGGGKVLLVDGEPQMTVCNGADGVDGADGAQGAKGDPGAVGATGATGSTGATGANGTNGIDALVAADVISSIEANAGAVVLVQCTADGVTFANGTGIKTQQGTVYTAEHVITGMSTCTIYSEAPITTLGSVTAVSQKGVRDQVELTVTWTAEGLAAPGLAPRLSTVPNVGDFVAIVGHPGIYDGTALEHQYTTGFVTATNLQATFDTVPMLAGKSTAWQTGWSTDAIAWHGNSGGPVFNQQGEWIGMLVGGFNGGLDNEGPDLSVVIPLF